MRRASPVLALAVALAILAASAGAGGRASAYRLQPVLAARAPIHLAATPAAPRNVYVVEREGRIRVATEGKLRRAPFLDLSPIVSTSGEEGLLSIAFHPQYARNRLLYVFYNDVSGNSIVAEHRADRTGSAAAAKPVRRLLFVPVGSRVHKGGQLAFGPDRKLYVAVGDGRCCEDPEDHAQAPNSLRGKVWRFDVAKPRPAREAVALGLRNPWRFSFDRATGDLWLADVGAGMWEEVNHVPRARLNELVNFGWDVYEGTTRIDQKEPSARGRLAFPLHQYAHEDEACSVTGGFVYRGSAVPAARGRYFFGDYCNGVVWSLRLENGAAADIRREPFTVPELASFGEDARGELYAISLRGRIFRLVP